MKVQVRYLSLSSRNIIPLHHTIICEKCHRTYVETARTNKFPSHVDMIKENLSGWGPLPPVQILELWMLGFAFKGHGLGPATNLSWPFAAGVPFFLSLAQTEIHSHGHQRPTLVNFSTSIAII